MFYRAKQAAALYGVTYQTIHVWSKEFAWRLSDTANPGHKKQRLFTSEDMQVFDLVASLQKEHHTFEEIHASLKVGSLGNVPTIEPSEVQAIVSTEVETRLSIENERLKNMLVNAQAALKKAEVDLKELRDTQDKVVRFEERIATKAEVEQQLREEIEAQKKRIEELAIEAGKQYAAGYKDGLAD